MRRAARKDQNQKEVERTLTDAGIPWTDTSRFGSGFPDMLALVFGEWHALEVKMPGESLTPDEETFHKKFKEAPLHIVYSGDHALFCMRVIDTYDPPIKHQRKQARKTLPAPTGDAPRTKTPPTPRKSAERATAIQDD